MMPESADFQDFLNHLTNNALHSLKHADAIARRFGSAYVGTEHLLLGVLAQEVSMGAKILEGAGVSLDKAQMALNLSHKTIVAGAGSKGLSETAKLTLKNGLGHSARQWPGLLRYRAHFVQHSEPKERTCNRSAS